MNYVMLLFGCYDVPEIEYKESVDYSKSNQEINCPECPSLTCPEVNLSCPSLDEVSIDCPDVICQDIACPSLSCPDLSCPSVEEVLQEINISFDGSEISCPQPEAKTWVRFEDYCEEGEVFYNDSDKVFVIKDFSSSSACFPNTTSSFGCDNASYKVSIKINNVEYMSRGIKENPSDYQYTFVVLPYEEIEIECMSHTSESTLEESNYYIISGYYE
jgi:hypothetical protein